MGREGSPFLSTSHGSCSPQGLEGGLGHGNLDTHTDTTAGAHTYTHRQSCYTQEATLHTHTHTQPCTVDASQNLAPGSEGRSLQPAGHLQDCRVPAWRLRAPPGSHRQGWWGPRLGYPPTQPPGGWEDEPRSPLTWGEAQGHWGVSSWKQSHPGREVPLGQTSAAIRAGKVAQGPAPTPHSQDPKILRVPGPWEGLTEPLPHSFLPKIHFF